MQRKYFIRENGKNIAYTFSELKNKKLKKSTKIWIEGSDKWIRLDMIPELNEISETINDNKNPIYVILSLFIIIITCGGYYYYDYNKKKEALILEEENKKLKPITSKELFNNYKNSVVLIKHSFIYKIKLGEYEFYFKEFNPETGETSDLLNYDEIKDNLNISWGTGFFVNNKGDILTNRHVVRVHPSIEEQNKILNYLKNYHFQKIQELLDYEYEIDSRIEEIENTARYIDLTQYEYHTLNEEYLNLKSKRDEIIFEREINNEILKLQSLPDNFVSKTSLEFGIFFNNHISSNYNDYIKYKSTAVSDNEDVDLALISVVNNADLLNKNLKPVDLSLFDSINIKPRDINEPVKMIAFNKGNSLAHTSQGISNQLTEGYISQINDDFKILYSIPALSGSSGAPIFDKFGRLISVNFAGVSNTQSFNYGIQTKQLQYFLKNNNIINPTK